MKDRPDVIFHLAAIPSRADRKPISRQAIASNLDGTRNLLEAIRKTGDGYKPKVIFTSSIAVFGAPFPPSIPDDFHLTPLTCYGAHKVICETLLADYTRRGFLDGVGVRLRGITVRPGKPNMAASGFFSGIIREPLAGLEAVAAGLGRRATNTHATPRAAVGFLVHAAGLTPEQLGHRINLTMPGVCCTVGEQIAALRRVAGDQVAARVRQQARRIHHEDRRGLAEPVRLHPRPRTRIYRRILVRRDHPRAYRGRSGRQFVIIGGGYAAQRIARSGQARP